MLVLHHEFTVKILVKSSQKEHSKPLKVRFGQKKVISATVKMSLLLFTIHFMSGHYSCQKVNSELLIARNV